MDGRKIRDEKKNKRGEGKSGIYIRKDTGKRGEMETLHSF